MNKMLVWFHSFPEESEVIIDNQFLEQFGVSAFQTADNKQSAKKIFSGNFIEFSSFIAEHEPFDDAEIVLPAKDVLFTQVSVPSKSKTRIMQAMPFVLEDNLIKDIDKQYFALGNVINGQCNIAIVSRYIIKNIYEQFKSLDVPVSLMTSEILMLPWTKETWSITVLQNNILIRTGEESGVTFTAKNSDFIFRLLLKQTTESEINKPDSIIIYTQKDCAVIENIKSIAQEYAVDCMVEKGDLLRFALSNNKISNSRKFNLLQGEYHPGNIKEVKIPFVKTMAAVFFIWLLSQIIVMSYQWQLNKNELVQVKTELQDLYFKTFPDSKRMVDVRAQTESKLQQLQKSSSSNDSFLSLLGLVGGELRQIKNIKIQNMRYVDGILQIDIRSKGFIFNQIKTMLQEKHGLLVEEKSSSKVKGEVHSVINFRLKNA